VEALLGRRRRERTAAAAPQDEMFI
jgi:hypothetical protein